jgi:hypothetical protein
MDYLGMENHGLRGLKGKEKAKENRCSIWVLKDENRLFKLVIEKPK